MTRHGCDANSVQWDWAGDRRGGNGAVNNTDLALLRSAFGTVSGGANYVDFLDFKGDGAINNTDLFQFRARFGSTLP
jgi:hypothetical protein